MARNVRNGLLTLVALGVVLSQAPPVAPADDNSTKYTLRYQFHPGEVLRWDVVHRTKVDTTVSDTSKTAETLSKSVKVWQVNDVKPDGCIVFVHRVQCVDMRHTLSGSPEVRYNSQTDKKPPRGFESVARSVGVPLSTITMNPQGKILKREQKQPSATPNEGPITIPLPDEAIAVGQSWSFPQDIDVPLPGGMIKKVKAKQTFTLESVATGVATIRLATQILTPVDDPAVESQLMQREAVGKIRFDIDAGRVLSQQLDVDKHVVGFRGQASSIHYLNRFSEELLPPETRTASRSESQPQ